MDAESELGGVAVLCGSGISTASGLPMGREILGLVEAYVRPAASDLLAQTDHELHDWFLLQQHFQQRYDREFEEQLPSDLRLAWSMPIDSARIRAVPLRFEGILDVLQRSVDPELRVLDVLAGGVPAPVHKLLATWAETRPVVTANFDGLIELAAMRSSQPSRPPFPVYSREADFEREPEAGLFKIHGSLWRYGDAGRTRASVQDLEGPVATLRAISATRESAGRKRFLHRLLQRYQVIVVGYSGVDDFDLSRWLRDVEDPQRLTWLQFEAQATTPRALSGAAAEHSVDCDGGLRRLAGAWRQRRLIERLDVVLTAHPERALAEKLGLTNPRDAELPKRQPFSAQRSALDKGWANAVVTGLLLQQLSHFDRALPYFARARALAVTPLESGIAELSEAEAKVDTGDPELRKQAFDSAQGGERRYESMELQLRSRLIAANVGRFLRDEMGRPLEGHAETSGRLARLIEDCSRYLEQTDGILTLEQQRVAEILGNAQFMQQQVSRHRIVTESEARTRHAAGLDQLASLEGKSLALHEGAQAEWREAQTIALLQQAIAKMQAAVELREDLGHVRGLCASLNVLGIMWQRAADWPETVDQEAVRNAQIAHSKSLAYAERHRLRFDAAQARVTLAVHALRLAHDGNRVTALLRALGTDSTLEERTALERDAIGALSELLLDTHLASALGKVRNRLTQLLERQYRTDDARIRRIVAGCRANLTACCSWLEGDPPVVSDADRSGIVMRQRRRPATTDGAQADDHALSYWSTRLERLEAGVAVDARDCLRRLLDPLAP